MAPDAEDCREEERLTAGPPGSVGGRRVLPGLRAPPITAAWSEDEELQRFVPPSDDGGTPIKQKNPKTSSKLQAGLTLGVHVPPRRAVTCGKPRVKTKFQKRKDKLIELLRPPYFILTMIVIIVVTHLASGGDGALLARLEWSPGAWRAQPWRALSYHLVHASAAHLALNALVALVVGWCIEREQGWARAAAVWAGGALGGALGAAVLQPRVRVVGASAAVYAMLTAHIPNVCLRFGHVPLWWFRPLSVAVLCLSEVCWTLVRAALAAPPAQLVPPPAQTPALLAARWAQTHDADPEDHVAWAAHAFGAMVGIPIGFIVFKGENWSGRVVRACRVVSYALAGVGLLVGLLCYLSGLPSLLAADTA